MLFQISRFCMERYAPEISSNNTAIVIRIILVTILIEILAIIE